jgi:hypothetical protein
MLPAPPTLIIHGNTRGADTVGKMWAINNGVHHVAVEALWDFYGKSAGYKRNSAMLLLQPEYCVAFPGGKGTDMMVKLCEKDNIPVWRPFP